VTDSARKVVFARLGERLRVAGMVEIVGYGRDIPPGRIAACASPAQVFPGAKDFSEVQAWCGMRPATPPACPSSGRLRGAPTTCG
jgi:D-amino-acid dehydrogenase